MKRLVYIAPLLLLFACGGQETEVVDLNDIMGHEHDEQDSTENPGLIDDSTTVMIKQLEQGGISCDTVIWLTEELFPDRFRPESTMKLKIVLGEKETEFLRWNYKDSSQVKSAFFNWLDCFGKNCKSIFVGQEKNLQADPFQIWMNDSSLIFIQSTDKLGKEWEEYLEEIGFEPNWKYHLNQRSLGKVKWFRYEEDEAVEIKNDLL